MDLRSDTVTQPSPAMKEAMAKAPLGDDVYGEDPTVNKLQELAAEKLGKEAALFVSSGTQGNLLSLLSHCQRGEEYIAGQTAHCYKYEAGGAAVLGSLQPQPIEFNDDGTLPLDKVASVIKPDDVHFAQARLLCLENTQGGKVLPLSYLAEAKALVDEHGLNLHLDGARVFNAAVKLNVDIQEISQHFDSVSFCLSKGLSAPIGSVIAGSEEFITRAHRLRKLVGGAMRQVGVIASAGIVALTEMVERLEDDHTNARTLAEGLADMPGFTIDLDNVQTNMVFITLDPAMVGKFSPFMREQGVIIGDGPYPVRAVTHYGIEAEDVDRVLDAANACSREFMA
ncbi:MAG: low-specificity L-threonine aldolase [Chloroflexota bacterium]